MVRAVVAWGGCLTEKIEVGGWVADPPSPTPCRAMYRRHGTCAPRAESVMMMPSLQLNAAKTANSAALPLPRFNQARFKREAEDLAPKRFKRQGIAAACIAACSPCSTGVSRICFACRATAVKPKTQTLNSDASNQLASVRMPRVHAIQP